MSDVWPIALKIGLSAVLAGAVGAERERTGKWAGLRTHMLIAVGSALLTDVSIRIGPLFHGDSQAWDPGRIAAQIVSGVGFIGAGTIIQSRGAVHGLTTAAGLWVAAAIGMAVGATLYLEAAICTAALLIILAALKPVENLLFGRRQAIRLYLEEGRRLAEVLDLFEEAEIEPLGIGIEREGTTRVARVSFQGDERDHRRLRLLAVERRMTEDGESGGTLRGR